MTEASSRRILSLVLPHLSTDRLARLRWGRSWRRLGRPEHPPVAITGRDGSAIRLVAMDEAAEALGLKPGLGLAEARARHPDLETLEQDVRADARFLDALADWCDRYTPLVCLDGAHGLMLDITGCTHLFGGEKSLLDDLLARLFEQGLDAGAAIASTACAARAMARYGSGTIVVAGAEMETLRPLPLAALALEPDVLAGLARVGLTHVGHIVQAPRAPLARRFGTSLLRQIDRALGIEEEPLSPRLTPPLLVVERRLAEPVVFSEDVERLSELLASALRPSLELRGIGARTLGLALFRVDGGVLRLDLKFARPTRAPYRLRALVHEKLAALGDSFDPGYGFEIVRLSVLEAAELAEEQVSLGLNDAASGEALASFTERTIAKLGNDVIRVPLLLASHVPERAASPVAAAEILSGLWARHIVATTLPPVAGERPIRLFSCPEPVEAMAEVPDGPPQRFRWRRALHAVARAEGPERIDAEWWTDGLDAPPRDYYRVEDEGGRRYWLYREGLYGGPSRPRWFLHGLFA
jgi:protein ImuB